MLEHDNYLQKSIRKVAPRYISPYSVQAVTATESNIPVNAQLEYQELGKKPSRTLQEYLDTVNERLMKECTFRPDLTLTQGFNRNLRPSRIFATYKDKANSEGGPLTSPDGGKVMYGNTDRLTLCDLNTADTYTRGNRYSLLARQKLEARQKALEKEQEKIRDLFNRRILHKATDETLEYLNRSVDERLYSNARALRHPRDYVRYMARFHGVLNADTKIVYANARQRSRSASGLRCSSRTSQEMERRHSGCVRSTSTGGVNGRSVDSAAAKDVIAYLEDKLLGAALPQRRIIALDSSRSALYLHKPQTVKDEEGRFDAYKVLSNREGITSAVCNDIIADFATVAKNVKIMKTNDRYSDCATTDNSAYMPDNRAPYTPENNNSPSDKNVYIADLQPEIFSNDSPLRANTTSLCAHNQTSSSSTASIFPLPASSQTNLASAQNMLLSQTLVKQNLAAIMADALRERASRQSKLSAQKKRSSCTANEQFTLPVQQCVVKYNGPMLVGGL